MSEESKGLTLEFVKEYIRVDSDDDDNYIKFLLKVAEKYVIGEIGECNQSDERVQMLMLGIIATMYEKRALTFDKKDGLQYTFNTIIMQLQMERGTND